MLSRLVVILSRVALNLMGFSGLKIYGLLGVSKIVLSLSLESLSLSVSLLLSRKSESMGIGFTFYSVCLDPEIRRSQSQRLPDVSVDYLVWF